MSITDDIKPRRRKRDTATVRTMTFKCTAAFYQAVRMKAVETDQDMSEIVRRAVVNELNKEG
ncbi:hypothetical protein [Paraburkholderia heleia]|uniref:hypothetical protein n=1 Tax=Paraburkholderia heleia TaxID=634127 RepID=UPI002AB7E8FA|nr:hypothetical protein [Paraburkholderia heleia]